MAYTPKPGSFSLFKNDRKEKDSHPDYTGSGMDPDGNEVWVSAWIKEGKKGKFMSCQMKLKDRDEDTPDGPKADEDEDSIPF